MALPKSRNWERVERDMTAFGFEAVEPVSPGLETTWRHTIPTPVGSRTHVVRVTAVSVLVMTTEKSYGGDVAMAVFTDLDAPELQGVLANAVEWWDVMGGYGDGEVSSQALGRAVGEVLGGSL